MDLWTSLVYQRCRSGQISLEGWMFVLTEHIARALKYLLNLHLLCLIRSAITDFSKWIARKESAGMQSVDFD